MCIKWYAGVCEVFIVDLGDKTLQAFLRLIHVRVMLSFSLKDRPISGSFCTICFQELIYFKLYVCFVLCLLKVHKVGDNKLVGYQWYPCLRADNTTVTCKYSMCWGDQRPLNFVCSVKYVHLTYKRNKGKHAM